MPRATSSSATSTASNCRAAIDLVWCSHVLEHQLDPHHFLCRLHAATTEGGVLAVTVPPAKSEIVGGHVSLWNAGLLLYRLVLAGFDCRQARVRRYGYNISVLLEKRSIEVPELAFDCGDIRRLRALPATDPALPPNAFDDPFDGDIDAELVTRCRAANQAANRASEIAAGVS